MKVTSFILKLSLILIILISCSKKKQFDAKLKNEVDSLSYYTGIFASRTLQNIGYSTINSDVFYKGIEQVFKEKENKLSKAEVDYIIGWYFDKIRKKQLQSKRNSCF
jgi:hypothetical protein